MKLRYIVKNCGWRTSEEEKRRNDLFHRSSSFLLLCTYGFNLVSRTWGFVSQKWWLNSQVLLSQIRQGLWNNYQTNNWNLVDIPGLRKEELEVERESDERLTLMYLKIAYTHPTYVPPYVSYICSLDLQINCNLLGLLFCEMTRRVSKKITAWYIFPQYLRHFAKVSS